MTNDPTTKRDAALWLLDRGHLNPSEAARLADTSRQLVMHWLKVEAIDWRRARTERLKDLWKRRVDR